MDAPLPHVFRSLPRYSRQQVALHQTLLAYLGAHVFAPEFALELRRTLDTALSTACSWSPPEVRVVSREDVAKLSAPLGYFAVLGTAPSPHKVLVELDPALAAWAVERLLGGREAQAAGRMLRPPTELELGVLSFLALQVVQAFGRGMVGGQELALRLERLVGESAEWLGFGEQSAQFVGLGMRVQLGERLGYLRILLPESLVQGHFGGRLPDASGSAQNLARMRRALQALPEVEVPVRVLGAQLALGADDIANVEPGDIIVLENHQLKLGPGGVSGQVTLLLGRGRHGSITARLYEELGEAKLEVSAIAEQPQPEEIDMDEASAPASESAAPEDNLPQTAGLLREVDAPVAVELGRIRLSTAQVVRLRAGQVLRLARAATDPVDLVVGGKLFARGELIEVDGELGVRLTHVTGDR